MITTERETIYKKEINLFNLSEGRVELSTDDPIEYINFFQKIKRSKPVSENDVSFKRDIGFLEGTISKDFLKPYKQKISFNPLAGPSCVGNYYSGQYAYYVLGNNLDDNNSLQFAAIKFNPELGTLENTNVDGVNTQIIPAYELRDKYGDILDIGKRFDIFNHRKDYDKRRKMRLKHEFKVSESRFSRSGNINRIKPHQICTIEYSAWRDEAFVATRFRRRRWGQMPSHYPNISKNDIRLIDGEYDLCDKAKNKTRYPEDRYHGYYRHGYYRISKNWKTNSKRHKQWKYKDES